MGFLVRARRRAGKVILAGHEGAELVTFAVTGLWPGGKHNHRSSTSNEPQAPAMTTTPALTRSEQVSLWHRHQEREARGVFGEVPGITRQSTPADFAPGGALSSSPAPGNQIGFIPMPAPEPAPTSTAADAAPSRLGALAKIGLALAIGGGLALFARGRR